MSLAAIIFSCDRPSQLELFLRTFRENAADFDHYAVSVFYKATQAGFSAGYRELADANPGVFFCPETDEPVKLQLDRLTKRSSRDFSAFFVDDDVFIRGFSTRDAEFQRLIQNPRLLALSLRLHPFVFFCQPLRCFTRPPIPILIRALWRELTRRGDQPWTLGWSLARRKIFGSRNLHRYWQKLTGYPRGDWAVWASVDGNVFRTERLLELLQGVEDIRSVSDVEPALERVVIGPKRMLCYGKPRLVNLAMNRVDQYHNYPCAGISHHEMNERFLRGERLDMSRLRGRRFVSCHLAVKPAWIKAVRSA